MYQQVGPHDACRAPSVHTESKARAAIRTAIVPGGLLVAAMLAFTEASGDRGGNWYAHRNSRRLYHSPADLLAGVRSFSSPNVYPVHKSLYLRRCRACGRRNREYWQNRAVHRASSEPARTANRSCGPPAGTQADVPYQSHSDTSTRPCAKPTPCQEAIVDVKRRLIQLRSRPDRRSRRALMEGNPCVGREAKIELCLPNRRRRALGFWAEGRGVEVGSGPVGVRAPGRSRRYRDTA